ncbi:hypothetical protein VTN02DRAFT_3986 [Thermoascus thermophilus]
MGGSSPPFLYDPPATYTFDHVFHPREASQSSWAPRQPPPTRHGPFVTFSRHPSSHPVRYHGNAYAKPMSPHTRSRVKKGRYLLLFLRVCTLIGALGSLFCAICIKGTTLPVAWVIRVAPVVATLHTLYAVYHLCRSPSTRPPASSATYMLFAASVDAGLIPFYAFTAFLAYGEHTQDAYRWGTLFGNTGATYQVTFATFVISVVNGGLHLVSIVISIYLAVIFRQISRLPPDMNPLEEDLTTRQHERTKSERAEKHLSETTLVSPDNRMSATEESFVGPTRTRPFWHTPEDSSDNVWDDSLETSDELRSPEISVYSKRFSRADLPSQQIRLYEQSNNSGLTLTPSTEIRARDSPSRPTSAVISEAPVLEPSVATTDNIRSGSPSSSTLRDGWLACRSRSPSPVDDALNENILHRETSSVYSRADTLASSPAYRGVKAWMKYGREGGNASAADTLGEYSSLVEHEYHENDEVHDPHRNGIDGNMEQDLGDLQASIFPVEGQKPRRELPFNPLALNPPTPRSTPKPKEDDGSMKSRYTKSGFRRGALTDLPNPSVKAPDVTPPIESAESKGRFYDDMESKPGLSVQRGVRGTNETHVFGESRKGSLKKKDLRRKSAKLSAYKSLKADDSDSDDSEDEGLVVKKSRANDVDGDRKGRVVSNSGVDIGAGFQSSSGSPALYGSHVAGLGVGRRREVSGKVAEEGRAGPGTDSEKAPEKSLKPRPSGINGTGVIRAAGWARFAGL